MPMQANKYVVACWCSVLAGMTTKLLKAHLIFGCAHSVTYSRFMYMHVNIDNKYSAIYYFCVVGVVN